MKYREEDSHILKTRMIIRVQRNWKSEPEVTVKMYLDVYKNPSENIGLLIVQG